MSRLKSNGVPKAETVSPIKSIADINKVKEYLFNKSNKRDYMLFVVGINVGLRASDLLSLKISDVVEDNVIKDEVVLDEKKTGKCRRFKLNASARDSIRVYLDGLKEYNSDDWLFQSRKGDEALRVDSVHRIIKSTLRELGIKGNYGSHTLRKTFAYHIYMNNRNNPRILAVLQRALNHSSQAITLRYIGIENEEIMDLYNNCL